LARAEQRPLRAVVRRIAREHHRIPDATQGTLAYHSVPHRSIMRFRSQDAQPMTEPVLLDLPTSIETARLVMRPPQAGDGEMLHAAVMESLPELRRFLASLPWVAGEQSVESSEIYCRNGHANFLARRDLPFLVLEKATGRIVGGTGLHRTVWSTPKTEIGYWCRTSKARNGLITEAVAALAEYAFANLRAARVEIVTDEENVPSRRVAERCRFVQEGILRHERRAPDGTLRNTCIYARIAPAP
jgi:RimJ/RimL family protein N-acetyltransferase